MGMSVEEMSGIAERFLTRHRDEVHPSHGLVVVARDGSSYAELFHLATIRRLFAGISSDTVRRIDEPLPDTSIRTVLIWILEDGSAEIVVGHAERIQLNAKGGDA